jgi:ubiquinone/menaquinone biosynthesis C-methylase UbiE
VPSDTEQLFDKYDDRYEACVQESIAFSGIKHEFFRNAKSRVLVEIAKAVFDRPELLKVLDVGCGIGLTTRLVRPNFADLHGIDVSGESIKKARELDNLSTYQTYDGHKIPYKDDAFDMAYAINVLHHVPPPAWEEVVTEIARVIRPGGLVAVIEHNPFNPLTRRAVRECEFDKDAVLLKRARTRALLQTAGLEVVLNAYIMFLPFSNRLSLGLERALKWLPLGAQYYVAAQKP